MILDRYNLNLSNQSTDFILSMVIELRYFALAKDPFGLKNLGRIWQIFCDGYDEVCSCFLNTLHRVVITYNIILSHSICGFWSLMPPFINAHAAIDIMVSSIDKHIFHPIHREARLSKTDLIPSVFFLGNSSFLNVSRNSKSIDPPSLSESSSTSGSNIS